MEFQRVVAVQPAARRSSLAQAAGLVVAAFALVAVASHMVSSLFKEWWMGAAEMGLGTRVRSEATTTAQLGHSCDSVCADPLLAAWCDVVPITIAKQEASPADPRQGQQGRGMSRPAPNASS